jgi:nucleotide-binding universal stress UspA family protein
MIGAKEVDMTTAVPTQSMSGRAVFARVLVGIDGSQQALEAARQGATLQDADGQLTLLSVWNLAPPIIGATGTHVPYYFDEEIEEGHSAKALEAASEYVAPFAAPTGKLIRGTPWDELIREIERDQDTLIAVGSSGLGRLRGIVEGSVVTEIIHKAPCSVLVARQAGERFPRKLVVGVDGSPESAAAYAAAAYLAERFGAELVAVVARGGKDLNERLIRLITDDHEDTRDAPDEALTKASETADLVVVGSRGLHGLRALGSVSERVAHQARCSTLVVREPIWQRVADELGRYER